VLVFIPFLSLKNCSLAESVLLTSKMVSMQKRTRRKICMHLFFDLISVRSSENSKYKLTFSQTDRVDLLRDELNGALVFWL